MISIVIPLYNKEKQIVKTIQSVLIQTLQDFEIVIVNDGSTDNSVVELEKIADARIRLIHQQNAGVSTARNKGIAEASYELIAFLDADDEWKPEYLETQYALYEKYPECSVYACNYELRYDNGKVSNTIIRKLPFQGQDGVLSNYFEVASCSHPPLWTSAVMVKKEAIQCIGGFPVGIKSGEDLLTWARLVIKHKIAYSQKVCSIFFRDPIVFNNDQKTRIPEDKDIVGDELHNLYIHNEKTKGLKQYNALWHKMRARIYIDKQIRAKAIKECLLSMKYNLTIKILFFLFLSLLPLKLTRKVFQSSNT